MYSFSKYKEQYRENLRLALPVILSQVGHIVVQLADNIMVGQYGGDDPIPLAAAAFGGGLFFLGFIAVMGLTFGITPIVGEYYAQGRLREMVGYLRNGLVLFGVIAVLAAVLQIALIPLVGYMGQPEEVVEVAVPYFQTLVWSLVPVIIFFVFKQFFEGIGNTKIAMWVVVASNVVNVFLNYLLIGGEMGAPELGAVGAGIATLVSRCLMAIIIVVYFLMSPKMSRYRALYFGTTYNMASVKRLLAMGFPISMQIFLEASSFVVIGFLFGQFGASAIGASQIGLTLGNCSFMIIVAIGSATTIRISHCYGRRDLETMRIASRAGWHMSALWNVVAAVSFFIFRDEIPRLFSTNEQVIELASMFVLFIVLYQIPDGIQCIGVGVLRGMQDVKRIPYIAFFSYWICNVPVAYLCAFYFGMGEVGLYVGFVVGFAVAASLLIMQIRRRRRILELKFAQV